METISLIRRLKFFGFLKVNGSGKHEEGRGFSLFITARPEHRLTWNTEENILVVYDENGDPWCRYACLLPEKADHFMHKDFPEIKFAKDTHVPHAFDKAWKKAHFDVRLYSYQFPCVLIDNQIDAHLERYALSLDMDNPEIREQRNKLLAAFERRQYPLNFNSPLRVEIVEIFESWAQENGLSDQIGISNVIPAHLSPPTA